MIYQVPRVVIAGLRGGSGKTTLCIALCRLFKRRGLAVVPFKKGPDYIDPGWLARASGSECYNLDPFMIPPERVLLSFITHSRNARISIIEGNRGLYDGVDLSGTYSTAELSKLLKAPVVVVVDCTKSTRTVAALLKGLRDFDESVELKAVVLNNIAGSRHESVVRGAIEKYTDLRVIGSLPSMKSAPIVQRHLGLTPWQEHDSVEETIESIASFVEEGVDIDEVLRIASTAMALEGSDRDLYEINTELLSKSRGLRIGVFRDEAFQFYYPENIQILKRYGMDVIWIDATRDRTLPEVDLLYIGGGFPETNAFLLSNNQRFMEAVRERAMKGMPVYAECGGLMYLGRELQYRDQVFRMVGLLPISCSMQDRPAAHGYTVVEVVAPSSYYPVGLQMKGHEFHYSRVVEYDKNNMRFLFRMKKGRGIVDGYDGILMYNVFATYTHLHCLSAPEWVEGLIRTATGWVSERLKKG